MVRRYPHLSIFTLQIRDSYGRENKPGHNEVRWRLSQRDDVGNQFHWCLHGDKDIDLGR